MSASIAIASRVEHRPVLDRPRAGPDRALRALVRVRVDRDERAVVRRLLDRGPQLVLGQLGRAGHAAAGQHGAGPDALDEVRAADEQPPDAVADLGRAT